MLELELASWWRHRRFDATDRGHAAVAVPTRVSGLRRRLVVFGGGWLVRGARDDAVKVPKSEGQSRRSTFSPSAHLRILFVQQPITQPPHRRHDQRQCPCRQRLGRPPAVRSDGRKILNAIEGIEDEDGNAPDFLKTDDPEMVAFRPRRANTGAKGVIEDAKRHRAMSILQAQAERVRLQEQLKRAANPTVKPYGEELDEDEDDDEEDEEFRKYKLERLKEMQKSAQASAGLPTFGAVESCPALQMPKAVDNAGSPSTYVIVHLQEDYLESCVRLGFKLEELAAKYDQVRDTQHDL